MINEIRTNGFRDTILQFVSNNEFKGVFCHLIGSVSNVIFEEGTWRFNITINDEIRLCCEYKDNNEGIFFENGDIIEAVGVTAVRRRGDSFTVTCVPLLDVKLATEKRKISEVILVNPRTNYVWICTGKKETELSSAYQSILIPYDQDTKIEDGTTEGVVGSFVKRGREIVMKIEHMF